ncbi:MAG: hypothetical protein ACI9W6_001637 [Motiliproteus sp.]|jgi:hypothetical protein
MAALPNLVALVRPQALKPGDHGIHLPITEPILPGRHASCHAFVDGFLQYDLKGTDLFYSSFWSFFFPIK